MRISDWSSDVCSSDLLCQFVLMRRQQTNTDSGKRKTTERKETRQKEEWENIQEIKRQEKELLCQFHCKSTVHTRDRKSAVSGKSESVRVDLGGGRLIKKTNKKNTLTKSKIMNN